MERKVILFDLDGTLTDSGEGIINCAVFALEHFGLSVPSREALRSIVGPPLFDTFRRFGVPEARLDEAVAVFRSRYNPIGIFENHPYPGIRELLEALPNDRIILTGVGEEDTGLLLRDCGEVKRYAHPRLPGSFSGTGDLFAAAFTGALAAEKGLYESAKIAADFTCRCIECTIVQPAHWYGVKFEPVLPELMRMLGIKNKNYPLSF